MSPPTLSLDSGKQALRFLLTGGLNTLVGFAVIWALLVAGVPDISANITGYAVGLVLSFFVNRSWTFEQSARPTTREVALFGFAFAIAYSANLAVIMTGQGMGLSGNPLLHLAGVGVYTIVFFLLSKTVVYAPSRGESDWRALSKWEARWPEYAVLALLGVLVCYILTVQLTHDVSWQFWIARQMLGGVPLYTYIMEINPPLWFWMALPFQKWGVMLGVSPERLYAVAIVAMAAWSAIPTGRLLFAEDARRRAIFMVAITLLCLIAPIYDFGQREQIAIILALPYAALIFKRVQGEPVSSGLALAIGVTAAFGLALKHYFALVPLALELWFLWQSRNVWRSFRIETIALGLCALSYGAAIAIITPDFFRVIVPMVNDAYQGYERSLLDQIVRMEVFIWIFAGVSYPALRRTLDARDRAIGDMLAITGIAFAASYFLQQKGWQYHAIPASVCASLLMIHCLMVQRDIVKSAAAHPAALLAAILFLTTGLGRGAYESEWQKPMAKILAKEKEGSSVMMLTTDPRRVFPFVDDYKLVWPLRHFAHWMVSGMAHAEFGYRGAQKTPELEKLAVEIRQQALEDMKCHPPVLILSQIRNNGVIIRPDRFRMTDFFRRDPAFRAYLADNYRLEWTNRVFEAYRRTTPLKVEGSNCQPISTSAQ